MDGGTGIAQFRAVFAEKKPNQCRNILLALAQRRQRDHHHVEPVVKILAEQFLANAGLQVVMRSRKHAHIHGDCLAPAQPLEALFLEHAEQLHLRAGRHVADFIQENGAMVGLLEAADALAGGPGERAAFMAEKFAFQQRFRNGRAVDGHKGRVGPVAVLVNGAGDQLLARAGLPADEYIHRLGGNAADFLVDVLHGRALPHNGIARGARLPQRHRLGHQPVALDRPADQVQQLGNFEGFEQVIVRTEFRRLNGRLGGAKGRDQDDRQPLLNGVQLPHEFQAAQARHLEIGYHHVEHPAHGARQPFIAAGLHRHLVAFVLHDTRERVHNAGVVVNEQDAGGWIHGLA